jgi:hypothetical protein
MACKVNDAAHRDGDRDEQQQRQQVVRFLDGERVHRRGEEPVEQQAGGHGGEHGRPEPADDRERHHRDQIDQQVVGQAQVRLRHDQQRGQQGQHNRGEQDPEQRPARADGVGHLGHDRARSGAGPAGRRRSVTSRFQLGARLPGVVSLAHIFQYGPARRPAQ